MADSAVSLKTPPSKITKILVALIGASSFVLAIALVITLTTNASAALQPTIQLGTAKTYAVLAGSGITNTGATTASGSYGASFGSSPTVAFTGSASVTTTGIKFLSLNDATDIAKSDLVIAYNDAAGRTPATPIAADLAGQTLAPGVYNSASSIGLSGALTLDGQNDAAAVFIFQAGSTLTTASASTVTLINGAQPCNVFWQVGSSATFGTNSQFVGHVLALTSITATTGATFKGQLLARNGAVTLDTNTFVNDRCAAVVTATPTATVVATPTPTPTVTPVVTPSATPTATPVVTPAATPTATPAATPTVTPAATPAPTAVVTPTATPVSTPTPARSSSPSRSPSAATTAKPASTPGSTPGPEATTDTGGQLPNTDSTTLYAPLAAAAFLLALGCAVYLIRRRVS